MWKKYQDFLRKRTDNQLLVGSIIPIFVMFFAIMLAVNHVFGVIIYSVIILISLFVMVTFCLASERRSAEQRKEMEREAQERLREELKEEVRKELEQEQK